MKEIRELIENIESATELNEIEDVFEKHCYNTKKILKLEEKIVSPLIEEDEELPNLMRIVQERKKKVANILVSNTKLNRDIDIEETQINLIECWEKYSDSVKKYLTRQEDYYIPILYKRFTRKNLLEIDTKIFLQYSKFNEVLIPKMMKVAKNSQQTSLLQHFMRIIDNLESRISINLEENETESDNDTISINTTDAPLSSISNQKNNLQLIINKFYNIAQTAQRNISAEEWSEIYNREPQLYSCIYFNKNWLFHYKSSGIVVWAILYKELQDGSKRIIEYSSKKSEKDIVNQIYNFSERALAYLRLVKEKLNVLFNEKLGWNMFGVWEYNTKEVNNYIDNLEQMKKMYSKNQIKFNQIFRSFRKLRRSLNVLTISQKRAVIPFLMLNFTDQELIELQVYVIEECKNNSISLLIEMVSRASTDEKLMLMNNVRGTKYFQNWISIFKKYMSEYELLSFNDSVIDISEESVKKRNKPKKEFRIEKQYEDSDDEGEDLKYINENDLPQFTKISKNQESSNLTKASAGSNPIMWREEKNYFLLPFLFRLVNRCMIITLEKFVDSIVRSLKGLRGLEIGDVQFYFDYFSKLAGSFLQNHKLISIQLEDKKYEQIEEISVSLIEKKLIEITLQKPIDRRNNLEKLKTIIEKLYNETKEKIVSLEENYTKIWLNLNFEQLCSMTKAVLIYHIRNSHYQLISGISKQISTQDEFKSFYKCLSLLAPSDMKKMIDCARLVVRPSQWNLFTSSVPPLSAIAIDKEHWISHPRYPIVALFLKLTHKWIEVELKEIMRLLRRKQKNVSNLIEKMLNFFTHLDKHTEIEDVFIQPAIQQKLPFIVKEEWSVEHRVLGKKKNYFLFIFDLY